MFIIRRNLKEVMDTIVFSNRMEFRKWLMENALSDQGIWIEFSKKKPVTTIKASEALEEALCFGWIDGVMKSIDENSYIKYFKQRRKNSKWSEKNKKIVEALEQNNLMTDYGRAKIEEAKNNGQWDKQESSDKLSNEELIQQLETLLKPYKNAYENYKKMTPSVQKTYAASYCYGAKTEEGKKKRLNTIIERLNLNLDPMQSMKKL